MSPTPMNREERDAAIFAAFERLGNKMRVAAELGVPRSTVFTVLDRQPKDGPPRATVYHTARPAKRPDPAPILAGIEEAHRRLAKMAPAYPKLGKPRGLKEPHCLEIDLFDVHFGKLCWAPESGDDYDLKIAERTWREAVEDLVGYVENFEIEEVLLPLGNDFLHFDNLEGETTSGTRVDCDGRYAKVFGAGVAASVWAVEYLAAVAPVRVLWVPGNHDRLASYHLSREVAAVFRGSDRVLVDFRPTTRKYHRYGVNLIGFAHGCDEPPADLPLIMATERPKDWCETTSREFHVGHFHHSKRISTRDIDSKAGVKVRTLQSLSGTDAWHFRKGWVGGNRAAEAFLWSRDRGYVANFEAKVRSRG